MAKTRTVKDSMGEMEVPADALYGASTMRAVQNFPISGMPFPRRFIRALGLIKKAAAEVNGELKDHPEYINQDPYGKGWILKLKAVKDNPKLLDEKAYEAFVQGQS